MTTTHTPGPWIDVEADEGCPMPGGVAVTVHRADEPWKRTGAVCDMVGQGAGGYDYRVVNANARLIALAPEMAEALRDLVESDDAWMRLPAHTVRTARALLARLAP